MIVAMEEDACGLETCVGRVSEIVEWCSRRGVERTSVYDGTGRMRDGAGRQALERALQKRSEERKERTRQQHVSIRQQCR